MRIRYTVALLLLSIAGTTMAQQNKSRLAESVAKHSLSKLDGISHIKIDLGQRNTLIAGFYRYQQIQARQNIDSVLRLFVANFQKVTDTTKNPTRAVYALFRLGSNDLALDLYDMPQAATSFRFRDSDEPVQVKTQQDTLQIIWAPASSRFIPSGFSIYLFVNNLTDIAGILKSGGVNAKLQTALESVRQYKGHDLTSRRMSFDMIQTADRQATFLSPGTVFNPFLSFQPGVGIGLIRNQWVPSLNLDVQFVPTRLHNVGYALSYTSTFFFSQSAPDGRFRTYRNDFLSVGLAFYYFNKDGRTSAFSRQIFSFYVGAPVHRTGSYFDQNTIRMGGTAYQKGLFKVQPELYMNGFFKRVYPGLRLVVGL